MTFRIASGVFAGVFLLSAAVQWNDPDPLAWMAGYGAVAVVSAAVAAGARPRVASVLVLVAVLAAFAAWSPSLQHTSLHALGSFGMSGDVRQEEVREAIGLGLATGWMAWVVWQLFRGD